MAMSPYIAGFDRATNSTERTGVMNIRKMNVRSGLAFGLLVFSIAAIAPLPTTAQTAKSLRGDNKPDSNFDDRPEREQYDNRAFPATDVGPAQQQASLKAFQSLAQLASGTGAAWQGIGPTIPNVSGPWTYTGRPTTDSGRVTSLALSPKCHHEDCKLFAGAAGGGIWVTNNALASNLNWQPSSNGILSNSIGSVIFDPTDRSARTLYVGTGEPNG